MYSARPTITPSTPGNAGELPDVLERAHAARGEDRNSRGPGDGLGAPDVGPALGAVPRDVRVDDGAGARRGRVAGQRHRFQIQHAGPAVDGHAPVRRVHRHDDPVGEASAHLAEEGGVESGAGADDGPARSRLEHGLDVLRSAQAAADFDGDGDGAARCRG